MKLIGKVNSYNGEYGTIIAINNSVIDFDVKDISFGKQIDVGDIVEFRLETRFPDIKLARNIMIIQKGKKNDE